MLAYWDLKSHCESVVRDVKAGNFTLQIRILVYLTQIHVTFSKEMFHKECINTALSKYVFNYLFDNPRHDLKNRNLGRSCREI